MEQYNHFRVRRGHLCGRRDVRRVDDLCSQLAQLLDSPAGYCVRLCIVAKKCLAGDANARPTQAVGVQELRIVGIEFACALLCGGAAPVNTRQNFEQSTSLGYGATKWGHSVLGMRDGDDSNAAGGTNG